MVEQSSEPVEFFKRWFEEAARTEPSDPNAMTLTTVDAWGKPRARIVLLKEVDRRGFSFFTNFESHKGRELKGNPHAALCFHWKSLRRQVRIEGQGAPVDPAESDAYFATRPRESQIGAWASLQSQTLPQREVFEQRVAHYEQQFADREVTRPPHWGGYVVEPDMVEFWYGANFRLHERMRWDRHGQTWTSRLLYP